LGAEQDAYFTVDSIGTPFAGGGLNTGLRDLARFGEMLRNDGQFNGQRIVPKAVVDDIRHGGDK
jgi:CubicO group peptidase (beta-lactamase class C family)